MQGGPLARLVLGPAHKHETPGNFVKKLTKSLVADILLSNKVKSLGRENRAILFAFTPYDIIPRLASKIAY